MRWPPLLTKPYGPAGGIAVVGPRGTQFGVTVDEYVTPAVGMVVYAWTRVRRGRLAAAAAQVWVWS